VAQDSLPYVTPLASFVTPAKAGVQALLQWQASWIPAEAGIVHGLAAHQTDMKKVADWYWEEQAWIPACGGNDGEGRE